MRVKKIHSLIMKKAEVENTLPRDLVRLDSELASINTRINSLYNIIDAQLQNIAMKIDVISNLLGITYNEDGSINTEEYTTHTHTYTDTYIDDTDDGSGVTHTTNKSTTGIN